VQECRALAVAQHRECVEQRIEIVAVDRTLIGDAECAHVACDVAGAVQAADVRRDRHAVVVEHDAQAVAQVAGVIERLERHARGRRAVADHRDRAPPRTRARCGFGDPERGRDRGARVARAEHVVRALAAAQESGRPVGALDPAQRLAASGERLVAVGLVADVPDDPVVRRVEDGVQRHGQLDRAETAREVSAHLGAQLDQVLAQLARHLRQVGAAELAQHARLVDRR
jgi:hypothetical protein